MTIQRESTDPRIAAAARLLHTYYVEGRTRTDLLKQLADVIVDLRTSHTLTDGRPDLGGRSPAYRAVIRDIYSQARIAPEHLDGVQTALRYHVNNRLHELYDAEELTAAGLGGVSHRERLHISRDLLLQLNATMEDQARLASHIDTLTEHLDAAALITQPAARRRAAELALESAELCIHETLAAVAEGRTRGRGAKTAG